MSARRLPPYARQLQAEIRSGRRVLGQSADGRRLTLWLVCGPYAWNQCREFVSQGRLATMLPPGEDPTRFQWSMLAGHDPVLLVKAGHVEGHELEVLTRAVMADGVDRVLDMGCMDRYVAQEARHAE